MRSFPLKDLLAVKIIKASKESAVRNESVGEGMKIMDKDDIEYRFNVNSTGKESNWPYLFRVEFT